ncbi:hypothetical protein OG552_12990 [Streptomyces sp. NBC_01476]|uniref:hypothetical protein n=1 Tax=Streptomyces sp. NBC_01476 TaxID=2903881 RepID=UPI002E358006|nr:hypothetical protein [Streptomyces sp. NBC_01476]
MEHDLFKEMHDVTAEVSCGAINPDNEKQCGEPGILRSFNSVSLILCEPCAIRLHNWRNEKTMNVVKELDDAGAISGDTPGWVYALEMNNGNIKFGTTADPKLTRFKSISRDDNDRMPVRVLGITQGGIGMETLTHERFKSSRVQDKVEQFRPTQEVVEFATGLGFAEELTTSLEKYAQYAEKNKQGIPRKER